MNCFTDNFRDHNHSNGHRVQFSSGVQSMSTREYLCERCSFGPKLCDIVIIIAWMALGGSQTWEPGAGQWFEFWLTLFFCRDDTITTHPKRSFCAYTFSAKSPVFRPSEELITLIIWQTDYNPIEDKNQGQEIAMNVKISIDQGAALQTPVMQACEQSNGYWCSDNAGSSVRRPPPLWIQIQIQIQIRIQKRPASLYKYNILYFNHPVQVVLLK